MLGTAVTYALIGVEAEPVRVEVDVRAGLPSFVLVGLPDPAVREARERVRAALVNCGFEFPQRRITANLAPADLRKAGPGFDLALAAALLIASEQLDPGGLEGAALVGELALDGRVMPIPGVLAMAQAGAGDGVERIVVPSPCGPEAALARGARPIPIARLDELRTLGTEDEPRPPAPIELGAAVNGGGGGAAASAPDLGELRGQPFLAHALTVAAAGAHSLLVVGPPGAGKSMAARRLPGLLPPLEPSEAVEAIRIASACGRPLEPFARGRRPFRAPHHTISPAGLLGGGSPPRPGEVSLAHRGVLFLDELPEFRRDALEALRQPLEDGSVLVSRVRYSLELPCRFQLIAAANPCPCGNAGGGECDCPEPTLRRYAAKLSGALADRIDISLRVAQPPRTALAGPAATSSAEARGRVMAARERQAERLGPARTNATMSALETRSSARLEPASRAVLLDDRRRLRLSGRGYERVIRVARTLADLADSSTVAVEHLEGALALRGAGA